MEEADMDYAAALAEAQQRGYAEANPTLDVGGGDAAHKLAILSNLAFGARVAWRDIPRVGIDMLDQIDMRYAKELGYRIKLLAVAERVPEGVELHVSPTLVRAGTMLAEVREAYNAIRIVGDAVGRVFFHGLGAGQMPTASAVVADLIDTLVGRWAITFRALASWSADGEPEVRMRDPAKVAGRFYLRLTVEDRPGVMAEITGILSGHGISIASIIQHESEEDSSSAVSLVIMTHNTLEGNFAAAMRSIGQLSSVHPGSVRMRVRD
jgi:homoserine dehydrogenase